MKKIAQVLTASLAVATMGVGVPAPTELKQNVTVQEQAPTKKAVNVPVQSNQQVINIQPGGHLDYKPYDAGTPPKYYGQYLQRIGKQKWTKAKR
jgi:guanyl-specific ribonuclease Sa